MSEFQSKYPEIITDKRSNSVNNNMTINITIEQLYDLMHHTHNVTDLVSEGDGPAGIGDVVVQQINIKINELTQTVNEQAELIQQLQEKIDNGITVPDEDGEITTG